MDIGFALTVAGLAVVLGSALSYLAMLFVAFRFTYRTWIFHSAVGVGMAMALVGWLMGGGGPIAVAATLLGLAWFVVARRELTLAGSTRLAVRPGDPLPSFTASTTDGRPFTDQDLVSAAPAVLVLYRGWWCPSSKVQLDEVVRTYGELDQAGLSVFAGSVDAPADAVPLQRHVGDRITILCDIPVALLDTIGVRDTRGAPWYDRLRFSAPRGDISMPAALLVDREGLIRFAHRSTRIDDRPRPADILASL